MPNCRNGICMPDDDFKRKFYPREINGQGGAVRILGGSGGVNTAGCTGENVSGQPSVDCEGGGPAPLLNVSMMNAVTPCTAIP